MRTWTRLMLWLCGGALALVIAIGGVLWLAIKHVPDDYEAVRTIDPQVAQEGSDQMLEKTSRLVSTAQRPGTWQEIFSEAQINGWLAVDLPQNHPELLPDELRDPRVSITPQRIRLGGTLIGKVASVLSLDVEVYLAEPNVVALRFAAARAGAVPMPMDDVLAIVSEAARNLDVRLRWRRSGGDPIALVELPAPQTDGGTLVVEALELRNGELYVAGTTGQPSGQSTDDEPPTMARQPDSQQQSQR